MTRWIKRLSDYWFSEAPAARLAALRILIGMFVLYYVGVRYDMFVKIARTDESLFAPVGLAALLSKPIEATLFEALLIATLLLNVAFILGWKHRVTGPLFGGLLLWVFCYRNSWSMIFHNDNGMVMQVVLLGLTASADAWSIDALRRGAPAMRADWRYGWPIRLMCALITATYFVSGVAKLASHGVAWADGNALRAQVAVDGMRKELLGDPAGPLSYVLFDEVWLFTLMGIGTLVLELGAPLALLGRRLSWFWVVNIWLMHWSIFFIMGITFRYQMAGFLFLAFFPVERGIEWAGSKLSKLSLLLKRTNPRMAHMLAAAVLTGATLV